MRANEVSGAALREPLMASSDSLSALPLFPLRSVLFPGGLLALKVFEARYLDLVSDCLRRQQPFGVVCLLQGGEVRAGKGAIRFESAGVLARLDDVDSERAGVLRARCTGTRRFRLDRAAAQQSDGLWIGSAALLPDDTALAPSAAMMPTVHALSNAIATLKAQGVEPFNQPHRLDDAGWVANRWCEILPISLGAKQKLMELDDPQVRLQLVHEYLRSKGVVVE
jgi:Lon protease-like protein